MELDFLGACPRTGLSPKLPKIRASDHQENVGCPPRFKAYPKDYYQRQLFPANVLDLLPEDHECFLYQELFEQLDTSEVEAQYSDRGQRAYAPRQIVSILIYARVRLKEENRSV